MRKHYQKLLGILVALTIGATSVSAANFLNSNSSPFQPLINLIGSFFNITLSGDVQVGVSRFAIFLILFTVINYAARNKIWRESGDTGTGLLAKKTSNIVAGIVALLTAILLPRGFVLGFPMILMAFALPLLIAGGSFWLTRSKDDGKDREVPWWYHFIGLILVMTAIFILFIFWSPQSGVLISEVSGTAEEILDELFAGLFIILSIMLLVHIFRMLIAPAWDWASAKIGGGGDGDDTTKKKKTKDTVKETPETPEEIEKAITDRPPGRKTLPLPNRVKHLTATPNPETDNIDLTWEPRAEIEEVDEYIVQRRTIGSPNYTPNYSNGKLKSVINPIKSGWAWTKNLAQTNIGGGWLELGRNTAPHFTDTKQTISWSPRYWTYGAGTTFNPSARYEYRVCARNRTGKGDWSGPAYYAPTGRSTIPAPGTPGGPQAPNPGAAPVHSFASELEDLQTKLVDLQEKLGNAEEIADMFARESNLSSAQLAKHLGGSKRGVDLRGRNIKIERGASEHDLVDLMREFRKRLGFAHDAFNGVNKAFEDITSHGEYTKMPAQELLIFRNKLEEHRNCVATLELLEMIDAAVIV